MSIFDWYEHKTPEELAKELGINDFDIINKANKRITKTLQISEDNNTIFFISGFGMIGISNIINDKSCWLKANNPKDLAIGMRCKEWKKLFTISDITTKHIVLEDTKWLDKKVLITKFLKTFYIFLYDFNELLNLKKQELYKEYNVLWTSEINYHKLSIWQIMKRKWNNKILCIKMIDDLSDDFFVDPTLPAKEGTVLFQGNRQLYSKQEIEKEFQIPRKWLIKEFWLLPKEIITKKNWTSDLNIEFNKIKPWTRVIWKSRHNSKLFCKWVFYLWKVQNIVSECIQIEWETGTYGSYSPEEASWLWLQYFSKDLEETDYNECLENSQDYNKRTNDIEIQELKKWMRLLKIWDNNATAEITDINLKTEIISIIEMGNTIRHFDFDSFYSSYIIYKKDLQSAKKYNWYINLEENEIIDDNKWKNLSNIPNNISFLWSRIKINGELAKIYNINYDKNGRVKEIQIKWNDNSIDTMLADQLKKASLQIYKEDKLEIPHIVENSDIDDYWTANYDIYDLKRWYICKFKNIDFPYYIIDIDDNTIKLTDMKDNNNIYEYDYTQFTNKFLIYMLSIDKDFVVRDPDDDVPF